MTERATSPDGTSIAFERTGSGPALVLVDAAGCFRRMGPMVPLAPALAANFTVVTYDRRGRGESTDTLPYHADREVADLAAVIEAVGGHAFVHGFSSGAVLALHAAAEGVPITALSLLEPPLDDGSAADGAAFAAELDALVSAGRRGDAVVLFQTSIGVPTEFVTAMREAPTWPAMEALAHTLVYDITLVSTVRKEKLLTATTPTLVLDSEGSDQRLRTWAAGTAAALPNGTHRSLPGEWHGVAPADLAAALTEFFRNT